MANFFRRGAALAVLVGCVVQPLGAAAYLPVDALAARFSEPAMVKAGSDFRSCVKEALTLSDAKKRDEVARPYCYAEFAKAIGAALNNAQENAFAAAFLAGLAQRTTDSMDSAMVLAHLRQLASLQKQVDTAAAEMRAITESRPANGLALAQLGALRADLAVAQKAQAAALAAKPIDAATASYQGSRASDIQRKIAFLEKFKPAADRFDSLVKQVDAYAAKYGTPIASRTDYQGTQRLIDAELALARKLNGRAVLAAIVQSATAPNEALSKGANFVAENPGETVLIAGGVVLALGEKTYACLKLGAIDCTKVMTDSFVNSTAETFSVFLFQEDLLGNPVSDEEWGRLSLTLPTMVVFPEARGAVGAEMLVTTSSVRNGVRAALSARLGETAASNLVATAVRTKGATKAAAEKAIVKSLQNSRAAMVDATLRGRAELEAAAKAKQAVREAAGKARDGSAAVNAAKTRTQDAAQAALDAKNNGVRPAPGPYVPTTYGRTFSTGEKVMAFKGQYALRYNDFRKEYVMKNGYILRYSDHYKLARLDGKYVRRYSDDRIFAVLEDGYVKDYNRPFLPRIASFDGDPMTGAALAVQLLLK